VQWAAASDRKIVKLRQTGIGVGFQLRPWQNSIAKDRITQRTAQPRPA